MEYEEKTNALGSRQGSEADAGLHKNRNPIRDCPSTVPSTTGDLSQPHRSRVDSAGSKNLDIAESIDARFNVV